MSRLVIKGGRVIDPANNTDEIKDLKIENGMIVDSFNDGGEAQILDADGLLVTPGLIDMHVHLREPGREDEETVMSGSRAATAGGFTTIVSMPNTDPPADNRAVIELIAKRAAGLTVNVRSIGAISAGLKGECLADMGDLADAGVVGFSDDGRPVMDSALMRRALEYSKVFDLPIISHAEDLSLANNGVMHEGRAATMLGLKGIPAAAEEVMVARDIILAELTGARLHITHVSTAGSVAMIKAAKARGVRVTADVTPHHLVLTEENLKGYDTNYKINPPLRGAADTAALVAGLWDGAIDAIASDHAPHAAQEKDQEIEVAPCGTIGLETTVPALLTHVAARKSDLSALIEKLTVGPARILGLAAGTLSPGVAADVTMIDTRAKVRIDTEFFQSKSRNSAWLGADLRGRARHVVCGGRIVLRDGELCL